MTRSFENRCFRRFQETRDPRLLGKVFDATAAELLRVAGHLANGDRELTQDALQATFLTAIEKSDSYDTERDVRPWLLGILANHIRKERRRTLRHRGSDVTAAGLAANGSPVAAAETTEFGAAAKAAMQKLPSPFREPIVLHLQHGLTAAEIADALGRPAGTVRTQIVRGMDRLRALLPAGFTAAALGMLLTPGPILAAVRQQVLATLPTVATASSSLVLTGWRLYAMMATGAAVVLSVLVQMMMGAPVSPPDGASVLPTERVERATADVDASRELVVLDAGVPVPQQSDAPKRAPIDKNLQPVALTVVYANDKPAANVPVAVRLNGILQRWHTDDRGLVELHLPWPGFHSLFVLGTHHQSQLTWFNGLRRPKETKERIVLPLGMQLDVTVVDSDGKPVPGATIDSSNGFAAGGSMLTMLGSTDASGRFVRDHVNAFGQLRVWADGYLPSSVIDSKGEIGGAFVTTVTLLGGALRAEGIVTDETGKPVAHAHLALVQFGGVPSQPQYFTSGDDGSFSVHTLKQGEHVIVGIHSDKVVRRGQVRFAHDGANIAKLELRMTRGARVVGQLKDEKGNALGGTNVVARDRPEGIHSLPFLETWTRSEADGSFVLHGLLPGGYQLECDNMPSQVVELADDETFTWTPTRVALLPISIRLLDSLGKPLVGWMASVMDPDQDWDSKGTLTGDDGRHHNHRPWLYPAGSFCKFSIYKKLGKSDQPWRDHAALPCLTTPPLAVGMEHEVRVPAHAETMHVLTGEVVDTRQLALAHVQVTLDSRGDGFYGPFNLNKKTDAAGSFRFEDLPPGFYHAYVQVAAGVPFAVPAFQVRGTEEISLGRIEIPDLGRVTVRLPADAASDGMKLHLASASGRRSWLRQQKNGTWRSAAVFHGTYQLQGWSSTSRVVPQQVAVGEQPVEVELQLVSHQATQVIVDLPPDFARNSSAWSGDLVGKVDGKVVVEHDLKRTFHGTFETHMEFEVSLPPGPLEITVTTWNKREGIANLTVPAAGGSQVLIQIK